MQRKVITHEGDQRGSNKVGKALTFRGVEDGAGLAAAGLPVEAVGQGADEVVLRALHDLVPHFVELLCVVDPAVELGVGVGELCTGAEREESGLRES